MMLANYADLLIAPARAASFGPVYGQRDFSRSPHKRKPPEVQKQRATNRKARATRKAQRRAGKGR